ncbi:Clp protease N-terminal domain-containing protein [Nocardia sp. NPDC006630]|uniref:Clp protease N-terminal domain-containing protein n=1 Tax=Nocardia sp. NPDC006630 TaxID=3157181 RepID=UPI0033BC7096
MFELLDDNAKRVILLATKEAEALGDDHIRPEHLLLGILSAQKTPALAELIRSIGLRVDRARLDITPIDPNPGTPAGILPFDDDAKHALRQAQRAALSLTHTHIVPEHLLLGVLGTAANDRVRAAVEPHLSVTEFRLRVDQILRDAD